MSGWGTVLIRQRITADTMPAMAGYAGLQSLIMAPTYCAVVSDELLISKVAGTSGGVFDETVIEYQTLKAQTSRVSSVNPPLATHPRLTASTGIVPQFVGPESCS